MLASCLSSPARISLAPAARACSGHVRQMLRRQHPGLIDDQHRAAVPAGRTAIEAIELGGDCRRIAEAVLLQVLHDLVGPAHADDPVAGGLVGVAHRGECRALAGSRLAGEDRDAFRVGQLPEGSAALAGDLRVPVEGGLALRRRHPVSGVAGHGRGVAHDPGFIGEHGARRVARDRRRLGLAQTDDLRQRQNLIGQRRPILRIEDDLGELAVQIAAAEGRAPLGQRLEDPGWASRADCPAPFVLLRPPLTLGREIDDLGRHGLAFARDRARARRCVP